jgi:DHA2 family multidrug resistance protein
MKGASGLFNLTRHLGGALGLEVINTLRTDRGALHDQRLSEAMSWTNLQALGQRDLMARTLVSRGLDGTTGALAQMAARVHGQATVTSVLDVFMIIRVIDASLARAALLMRPAARASAAAAH